MGQCVSAGAAATMPLPKLGTKLDQSEVTQIITSTGIGMYCHYKDATYVTINYADFKRFADMACAFGTKYMAEGNDCDDFAWVFLGRAREYYARNRIESGALFGYLDGDIKMADGDPMRGHAVCWFIDENKRFWIYDPQWNHIHEWKKSMTAWNIIV